MNALDKWAPVITSMFILFLTAVVAYVFGRFFNRAILQSAIISKRDPTKYKFLKHTLTAIIYIVGFSHAIYVVESLRTLASSLLTGAGILAAAIGLASQSALSNIVNGVFIIIFKPYKINDQIIVKDKLQGVVEDITLRHTVIRDAENRRIVIPNNVINNEVVINADLEEKKICYFIKIGISYDSEIKKARRIMQEEATSHPFQIDTRTAEQIKNGVDEVVVRVVRLEESSVVLQASVWAANQSNGYVMQCELLERIKERFDAEGIVIPFPTQTVIIKNEQVAHSTAPEN